MLIGQEELRLGLGQDLLEERSGDLAGRQRMAVPKLDDYKIWFKLDSVGVNFDSG